MSDYISREAALTELQNPELFKVNPVKPTMGNT